MRLDGEADYNQRLLHDSRASISCRLGMAGTRAEIAVLALAFDSTVSVLATRFTRWRARQPGRASRIRRCHPARPASPHHPCTTMSIVYTSDKRELGTAVLPMISAVPHVSEGENMTSLNKMVLVLGATGRQGGASA